ncbi:hypothetical protein ACIBF7_33470 [Nonomuraea sp. NPDC050478]|uniref:hypothetical protein n=1 Tax=Nonomuraea sp. NPDC050478 TaxID=3364365 RepID=UPI0037BA6354
MVKSDDPIIQRDAGAAAGVPADATESAVRVASGRLVTRAEGFGAGHAAASLRIDHPA